MYGTTTLYRARGDQTERYGYAAFSLYVIPYTLMSVANLCCACLLPDYPTIYVVRSKESDEAVALGGQIDGAVERVFQEGEKKRHRYKRTEACFSNVHKKLAGPSTKGALQN